MKQLVLVYVLVVLFLSAVQGLAQVQQDAQAVSVLSSAYQAMGGNVASSIQDTHTTVQVTGTDANGNTSQQSVTIETSGQKINMQNPMAGVTLIVNDTQMQITTNSGSTVSPSLSFGNAGVVHLPIFSALADWSNPQVVLKYIGLEKLGSSNVHHVQMQRLFAAASGMGGYDQALDFYVDATTFYLVKLLYIQRAATDLSITVPLEADYSNYQQINGVMVPMSVTYVIDGSSSSPQIVSSFAINQGSQPSDFQIGQ